MKTKEFMLPRMTIEEFADKNNLVMEIHERSDEDSPSRFYAHFEHSDIAKDGMLIGKYGDGESKKRAILNYAMGISGKVLVIGAFSGCRREIVVPILVAR